jgi:hypothetical protein
MDSGGKMVAAESMLWSHYELNRSCHLCIEQSQMELHAISISDQAIPLQAYTNLVKASWILIDIIACHPQRPFFDSSTHYEVQLLSAVSHSLKTIDQITLRY